MKDFSNDPTFRRQPAEPERIFFFKRLLADNRYDADMVRAAVLSGSTKKGCERILRVLRTDWEDFCRQEVEEGRPFPPRIDWGALVDEICQQHPEELDEEDYAFFLHAVRESGRFGELSPRQQKMLLYAPKREQGRIHLSKEQHRLENLVGEDKRELCEEKCAACDTLHHVGEMFVFFAKSDTLTWEEISHEETYDVFIPFLQHVDKISCDNIRKNIKSVLKSKGMTPQGRENRLIEKRLFFRIRKLFVSLQKFSAQL